MIAIVTTSAYHGEHKTNRGPAPTNVGLETKTEQGSARTHGSLRELGCCITGPQANTACNATQLVVIRVHMYLQKRDKTC